jgi:hypothetical protein
VESEWIQLELGGRFSYYSLQVDIDFEPSQTLTYTDNGFAGEALVVPELPLSRYFALGAVLGLDTRAMARGGVRVDARY